MQRTALSPISPSISPVSRLYLQVSEVMQRTALAVKPEDLEDRTRSRTLLGRRSWRSTRSPLYLPHVSPASPCISLHLPASPWAGGAGGAHDLPCISPVSPCIFLHLPCISLGRRRSWRSTRSPLYLPCISLHLPASPCISLGRRSWRSTQSPV